MEAIISAFITGALALIGVVITNSASNRQMQHKLDIAQAVTNEKISELTREVREHNNFARRVPVMEEKIKVINNRIKDLEDNEQTREG